MKNNKKAFIAIGLTIASFGNINAQKAGLNYPKPRKADISDNYFGTKVADPYRWMENDTTSEVNEWVKTENKVTQDYLAQIPYRKAIHERLTDIWNYTRYSVPIHKGSHFF